LNTSEATFSGSSSSATISDALNATHSVITSSGTASTVTTNGPMSIVGGSVLYQTITLAGFSDSVPDQFTLTYGANTTAAIDYSTNAATQAANILAALNLPAILGAGNTASVAPTATPDVYVITFGGSLTAATTSLLTGAPVSPATGTVAGNVVSIDLQDSFSQLVLDTTSLTAVSDAATGSAQIIGAGTVTLAAADPIFTVNDGPRASDLIVLAPISGSTDLFKAGAGRLELGGVNTYGDTTIYSGDVQIDAGAFIGDVALDGTSLQTLTLAGFSGADKFKLTFGVNTTAAITFSTNAATMAAAIEAELNQASIIGAGNTATVTPTGTANVYVITFGGGLAGTNVAPITGAPVAPATGTATAAVVSASLSGNGNVGVISMADSNSTGIVNPGVNATSANTGALNSGDVTWNAKSTFWVDLKSALNNNDVLHVVGDVNLGDALLTGTAEVGIPIAQDYVILTYTGTLSGQFVEPYLPNVVFISGQKFLIDYGTGTNSQIILTRTAQTVSSFSLSASVNPSAYGQDVVFTATAVPEFGAGIFPPGLVVDFILDQGMPSEVTLTNVPVNTITGQATFDPQAVGVGNFTWTVGAHTVDATFRDTNVPIIYNSATLSPTFSQTVAQNTVSIALSSTPAVTATSPVYGQNVTVTANLTPVTALTTPLALQPTNTVTFTLDAGGPGNVFTGTVNRFLTLSGFSNGQSFTLSSGASVTGSITYSTTAATMAANLQAALPAILGGGTATVTPTSTANRFQITFGGSLAGTNGPSITGAPVGPATGTVSGNLLTAVATIPATLLDASSAHVVHTSYDGDTRYAASATPIDLSLTIQKDSTSISITPSSPTSPLGQILTFTVEVTPGLGAASLGDPPTGTLVFYDNSTANVLASVPYPGSAVDFDVSSLTQGPHTIYVKFFDGDGNYTDSPLVSTTITITKAASSTEIQTADPTSSTFGTPVTFTIHVDNLGINPIFGQPGGTVTLWDGVPNAPGSINLGTGAVNEADGQAAITTLATGLPQGNRTIYAVYSGDANFATSTSPGFSYQVDAAATTVTVSAVPSGGAVYGQAVTFTAILSSAAGTPSAGNVQFVDSVFGNLGTVTEFSPGVYKYTTTTAQLLTVGLHTITASYTNTTDSNFANNSGQLVDYSIAAANTQVTVTALPIAGQPANTANYGNLVTFKATVVGVSPGGGGPTDGTLTFYDTVGMVTTPLGVGTLSGNVYSYTTTNVQLAVGTHIITAEFTGDSNLLDQTGTLNGYTVNPAPTTVSGVVPTWSTSPTAPVYGQAITFTVTVTAVGGAPNPTTGAVTFKDGAATIGTFVLSGSNTAFYTVTTVPPQLAAGSHSITATYSGSSPNYLASAPSAALSQTVTPAPTAVTSLTSSFSPGNVSALGQLVTYTAVVQAQFPSTVAPVNAVGTVTFRDNGVPIGSPVAVNASGVANVSVTYSAAAQLGTHNITATYNAPTVAPINYLSSATSAPITQTVKKAASVTVAPIASGNSFGLSLTYIGTVKATNPVPPGSGTPTGTISVYEGANLLATATLTAGATIGTANFTVIVPAGLSIGNHTLDFKYSGDTTPAPGFVPAIATINQLINPAFTSIALTSSSPLVGGLPQSTYGQPVTFTAIVTAASAGTPTNTSGSFANGTAGENIVFRDNGNVIAGTVTRTGTTANAVTYTLTTAALTANVSPGHSITANYQNGGNFADSTKSLVQKVLQAGTTTALSSSSPIVSGFRQSTYGEAVTFTVVVTAPTGGTPTTGSASFANGALGENIVFRDNGVIIPGTVILTGTTANSATFTLTTSTLGANMSPGHTILATYSSNAGGNFATSASSLIQKVTKVATTTVLSSSSPVIAGFPQSNYGEAVTFTAVVTSATSGSPAFGPASYSNAATTGIPLTFYAANSTKWTGFIPLTGTVTRTATTANSATYAITISTLTASLTVPYQVQALYRGNANFLATPTPQISAQPSAVVFQKVAPAVTTTAVVSATPSPSAFGQSVTFTATVTAASGKPPTAASMKFFVDTVQIGVGTLVSSTATTATYRITRSNLTVGSHDIQAQWVSNNANFASSSISSPLNHDVNPAPTATTLVSSPGLWASDTQTTFTANVKYVAGTAGSLATGGSVTFTDSAGSFAPVTVTSATIVNGYVSYKITRMLNAGPHTITAEYSNTNANIIGSSDARTQNVHKFSKLSVTAVVPPTIGAPVSIKILFTGITTGVTTPIPNADITVTIRNSAGVVLSGTPVVLTTNSSGVATLSNAFPVNGNYTITAEFTSDGIYNDAQFTLPLTVKNTGRLQ
jgi:hypothetical protein